jgi:hypothetical protein
MSRNQIKVYPTPPRVAIKDIFGPAIVLVPAVVIGLVGWYLWGIIVAIVFFYGAFYAVASLLEANSRPGR